MDKKRRLKKRLLIVAAIFSVGVGFLYATNASVLSAGNDRIHTDLASLPNEPVGLVLGTAPNIEGRPNLFFLRRIAAAAELYKSGKVKKLLVSGDNGRKEYDEPTAMMEALVKRGVPEADIVRDYAGFRTLDSIVRAHRIFGVERCVIVTDDFHLPRALYVARQEKMDAIGYQTEPLPRSVSPQTYFREVAARTWVWMDMNVLGTQPKFLGVREPIAFNETNPTPPSG